MPNTDKDDVDYYRARIVDPSTINSCTANSIYVPHVCNLRLVTTVPENTIQASACNNDRGCSDGLERKFKILEVRKFICYCFYFES